MKRDSLIHWGVLLGAALLLSCGLLYAEKDSADQTEHPVEARTRLESLNSTIGEWRGIAQPRRGSRQGVWKQTAEVVWDFSQTVPAVRYLVTDGRLVQEGRLRWVTPAKAYVLEIQTAEGQKQTYTGNWEKNRLILTCQPDEAGVRRRITFTPLSEKRLLVLHEKTAAGGMSFQRVAEVGYTREGTHLAKVGGVSRECVVTGGTGTSTVIWKGKTYYVCCSGCRQAFEEDPEGILEEYHKRVAKQAAE